MFQVDDGWQRANGDWDVNDGFPSGMAALAERVQQTGRIPGLSAAPFLVDEHSELVRRHGDMVLRDASGLPVVAASS